MSEIIAIAGGPAPTHGLYYDGAWRSPKTDAVIEVRSPATGAHLATVPNAASADIDAAVRAAQLAFIEWSALDTLDRARQLRALANLIGERIGDLAAIESAITGRPIREMRAQMGRIPEWLEYFAAIAVGLEAESNTVKGGFVTLTRYEPMGVCALLTPWNHPVLILVKKLAAALAAGNTCVVKPSELAPVTPLLIADWAREAGLPDGVVNVVTGDGATGAAVCNHPHIAHIDLTGGTATGRKVATAAAERLVPCTLELGGKTPVLVFADTPIEEAAAGAAFAAFVAAGQTCVSGARFLVEDSIYETFVERFADRARAIRVGDPADPSTEMGPVISAASRDRCLAAIAEARTAGARCVAGGGIPNLCAPIDVGHYVEPTVFADVLPDMALFQNEIFGPVVSVTSFANEAEAISLANDSEYALGAALWTRDITRALRVGNRLRSGVMWINDHHKNDPRSIWGGFGASGYGKENGWDALKGYLHKRSMIVRTASEFDDWFGGGKRYG
jgi:acyl-CoA reductase-like NAD-dependent aldehyde dehydrogenase